MNANELPAPRLELRWHKTGDTWEQRECVYSLVMPLRKGDIRREGADGDEARSELSLEMGRTKVTGGWRWLFTEKGDDGQPLIDTPFRDGSHAQWDSETLGGLPIFAVFEDKALKVPNYN